MVSMAITSFFVVEQEILVRLQQEIPELKGVYTTESLATIIDKAPTLTPSVYIAYDNYDEPDDANKRSPSLILAQRWIIILATKNMISTKLSTKSKDNSGLLLTKVIGALLDWTPPSTYRGLQLSAAPKPIFSTEGVDFFSLAFIAHLPIKAIEV